MLPLCGSHCSPLTFLLFSKSFDPQSVYFSALLSFSHFFLALFFFIALFFSLSCTFVSSVVEIGWYHLSLNLTSFVSAELWFAIPWTSLLLFLFSLARFLFSHTVWVVKPTSNSMTAPTEVFNSLFPKVLFSPQSIYSHTLSLSHETAFFNSSCIKQKRKRWRPSVRAW